MNVIISKNECKFRPPFLINRDTTLLRASFQYKKYINTSLLSIRYNTTETRKHNKIKMKEILINHFIILSVGRMIKPPM